MDSEECSDDQRDEGRTPADMVSSFILNAPPGELVEVLEAVKGIVRDEKIINDQVSKVLPKYTKTQLTPVNLEGSDHAVILSNFNDIGGIFVDPRSKKSFTYDHVTGSISNIEPWEPDATAETWRFALEQEWTKYSSEHYHEGAGSVFSSVSDDVITLNACLEGHQFQPKKFWNGRWRSVWNISFHPSAKQAELNGLIRLHVHYYEDGNVQLVSSRRCDSTISITVSFTPLDSCALHCMSSTLMSNSFFCRTLNRWREIWSRQSKNLKTTISEPYLKTTRRCQTPHSRL